MGFCDMSWLPDVLGELEITRRFLRKQESWIEVIAKNWEEIGGTQDVELSSEDDSLVPFPGSWSSTKPVENDTVLGSTVLDTDSLKGTSEPNVIEAVRDAVKILKKRKGD